MAGHLAIVLPGRAYGPLGPALRLPTLALQQGGASEFVVEYGMVPTDASKPELWAEFHRSVGNRVRSVVRDTRPERITFLAKSLGTVALAAFDTTIVAGVVVDAIWVTPLFGFEVVKQGAISHYWRSLLVAGSADEAHNSAAHETVRASLGASSLILPGADHGLEVAGDVWATLDGLHSLVQAVLEFAQAA